MSHPLYYLEDTTVLVAQNKFQHAKGTISEVSIMRPSRKRTLCPAGYQHMRWVITCPSVHREGALHRQVEQTRHELSTNSSTQRGLIIMRPPGKRVRLKSWGYQHMRRVTYMDSHWACRNVAVPQHLVSCAF